jgi:hypothetical protein
LCGPLSHYVGVMRPLVGDISNGNAGPIGRAFSWSLAWSRGAYPGFHAGAVQIIGHWVTPAAIGHWRKGRRQMQIRDAVRLRHYVATRVAEGQDILAELDSYIAMRQREPRRLHGCCVVREDGLDRQGRWQWRG